MKRLLDLQCKSCGMIVRRWLEIKDIETEPCPNCGKKEMEWRPPEFQKGPACGVSRRGFSL